MCLISPRYKLSLELILCWQTVLLKKKVLSLSSFNRYKYKYDFLHNGLSTEFSSHVHSILQEYQKGLPKTLHSCVPEHRWKNNSIGRFLLLRDDDQVLWILGFLIILFAGSLPPLNSLHSIEIRMKIVCAYVHPTSRASPCAWQRKVRTSFLAKELLKSKSCLVYN